MRKLVLLSILVIALGSGLVFSLGLPTTIEISENITISVGPGTLDFGIVAPGTEDNPSTSPIEFDANGSNVNVTVEVTEVTGDDDTLFDDIEVETSPDTWVNIVGADVTMICDYSGGTCVFDPVSWDARLDVPEGLPAGTKAGTIVYTVSGPT
ncbi:MAG: hypothetical protein AABW46_01630 [Nanoarchaeota archaeon]